jgi:hypothetical protein
MDTSNGLKKGLKMRNEFFETSSKIPFDLNNSPADKDFTLLQIVFWLLEKNVFFSFH